MKVSTKAIHVGNEPDKTTGAVIPPIYQTSTYAQKSPGKHLGYEYTRSHNPTRTRLEECLASLENTKFALTTSSGMAAAGLIMQMLPAGSTILCGDDVYGGTYRLFTTVYNERHKFIFLDTTKYSEVKKSIKKYKPAMVWLETPTNPLLKITDISRIKEMLNGLKSLLVVDNTFMSPAFQQPLKFGADLVLHSMTKYLNGHSDVVGGCIMTKSKTVYDKLWILQNSTGPSASPFDSWLVLRGLKTLGVRMKAHNENAQYLANWLSKHPKVEHVIYPGLKNHPQYDLAKKQMTGMGGMISLYLKTKKKTAISSFFSNLELFTLAESLGGVESLIEHPGIMTHASIPSKRRQELGITDNLIRLSVGIEDIEDLKKDLTTALKSLS